MDRLRRICELVPGAVTRRFAAKLGDDKSGYQAAQAEIDRLVTEANQALREMGYRGRPIDGDRLRRIAHLLLLLTELTFDQLSAFANADRAGSGEVELPPVGAAKSCVREGKGGIRATFYAHNYVYAVRLPGIWVVSGLDRDQREVQDRWEVVEIGRTRSGRSILVANKIGREEHATACVDKRDGSGVSIASSRGGDSDSNREEAGRNTGGGTNATTAN